MTNQFEPEFSRTLPVGRIKSRGVHQKDQADRNELENLKQRLGLLDISALAFEFHILPWKRGGVRVRGKAKATITERCVVSLEPFQSEMEVDVDRFFTASTDSGNEEIIIDMDNPDEDTPDEIVAGAIDLGEIAVESLALELSPYPKSPQAHFKDHIESAPQPQDGDSKPNPFDVLKDFKSD